MAARFNLGVRVETKGNTIIGNYFDMPSGNEIDWKSDSIKEGNIVLGNINQGQGGTFILNNFIGSNVGIGTTNPSGKLAVQGGTPDAGDLFNVHNATGQVIGRIYPDGSNNGVLHVRDNAGNVNIQLYSHSLGSSYFMCGNVGIGTSGPAANALLELFSTSKALILTRLTTAQRDAMTAVNGMIIYNTSTNTFQGRTNTGWVNL